MFEKALILRAGVERKVDLGLVAETLFLYGSTQLLLDRGSLIALTKGISSDDLLAMFDRGGINLSYLRQNFAVMSAGMPICHNFGAFTFSGTNHGKKKISNYQEEIVATLEREFGGSKVTRKLADAIASRANLHRFKDVPEKEKTVCDLMRSDIRDKKFVKEAVKATLAELVPEYELPKHFRYELVETSTGYVVDSDLNYQTINGIYHRTIAPSHSTINDAFLLVHILEARTDTFFAAYYMAEPVTSPLASQIIRLKHFEFLRRKDINGEEFEQFLEVVVPGFPSIRESINSKERTFSEFLKLLDKADRFKSWLQKSNPDAGLVQNYHKAVTEQTWADKLTTKAIRFVAATGMGVVAEAIAPTGGLSTIAGIGVGALDAFYFNSVIKSWRPNHFIEGEYKEFVSGKQKKY